MISISPMKILMTGGTGFIGQAVLKELLRRGHWVVATTRNSPNNLRRAPNLEWVAWDGATAALPDVPWRKFQAILHMAASTNHLGLPDNTKELYELSVGATFRLLEAARFNGVPRVLVASTGDVLGSSLHAAREEDVLYAPSSFYGTVKACAELLLRSYRSALSTSILRFYHPFGPGGDHFLVNRLIPCVAEGREIKVEGQNGIRLNPVWVDDLAVGVCLAVESEDSGIFHFGGPQTMSLRELAGIIGKLVRRAPVIQSTTAPCIQRHAGSFDLTARILGYQPKVSVEEGLAKLLARAPCGHEERG
jgi:nucleoside-diphosphate-sugar epimerase